VPHLVAALVLVGALALLNLLLTYGLIRRLREQAALLTELAGGAGAPPDDGTHPAGSAVGPFRAEALDATVVDAAWFDRPTLVGFLSPGCAPCAELLPRFAEAAATTRALAVVEPGPDDDGAYRAALAGRATVVAGEQARAVLGAFGVRAFPAVCRVDAAGVITATGTRLVDDALRASAHPGPHPAHA